VGPADPVDEEESVNGDDADTLMGVALGVSCNRRELTMTLSDAMAVPLAI
jgi:hypothetical protein